MSIDLLIFVDNIVDYTSNTRFPSDGLVKTAVLVLLYLVYRDKTATVFPQCQV